MKVYKHLGVDSVDIALSPIEWFESGDEALDCLSDGARFESYWLQRWVREKQWTEGVRDSALARTCPLQWNDVPSDQVGDWRKAEYVNVWVRNADRQLVDSGLVDARSQRQFSKRVRQMLTCWIKMWIEGNWDITKLRHENAVLNEAVVQYLAKVTLLLVDRAPGYVDVGLGEHYPLTHEEEAARLLVQVNRSYHPLRFRVCERKKCARVYRQKTDRGNQRFCSPKCQNSTVRESAKSSHDQDEREKSELIKSAIAKLSKKPNWKHADWQDQVIASLKTGAVTKWWLTRHKDKFTLPPELKA